MKKLVIVGLASATIGAVAGYFIGRKMEKEDCFNKIEQVRNYYKSDKYQNKSVEKPVAEKKEEKIPDVTRSETSIDFKAKPVKKENKYLKPNQLRPYTITPDEWENNEKNYAQMFMSYYEVDEILSDDNDYAIFNIESTIGDALDYVGEFEQNYVYVCNDRTQTLYCVQYIFDSYENTTGIPSFNDDDTEE